MTASGHATPSYAVFSFVNGRRMHVVDDFGGTGTFRVRILLARGMTLN